MQPQRADGDDEEGLRAGDVIAGRFEIVRALGRGGMATVYEARHKVTRRPVALKVASQKLVNNQLLSGRFLREARTASTIRHAHAIEVADVFEAQDGRPVMVMELLKGRDLAKWIADGKKMTPAEVADVFVPVLSALAHAHAEGIIHRDMKPDNIFLADVGGKVIPKVLDFGIAKVVGEAVDSDLKLTSTGMLLGTPFYMSPEQVSGREDLDHLADIWSVGVCLYEALNGELPFRGANFGQVFAAILQADPPKMKANVPPELESIVRRCLSKKPEDRPADCGELAEALRAYGGTESGKYPAPATASGRFDVVRADDVLGEPAPSSAPTLAEDETRDELFDDTTMNVRPATGPPRGKLVVAALLIGVALVATAYLLTRPPEPLPQTSTERETSEPILEDVHSAVPEREPDEVEERVTDEATPVEDVQRAETATMTVGMTRTPMRGAMAPAEPDPEPESTMTATMSGIIDEL